MQVWELHERNQDNSTNSLLSFSRKSHSQIYYIFADRMPHVHFGSWWRSRKRWSFCAMYQREYGQLARDVALLEDYLDCLAKHIAESESLFTKTRLGCTSSLVLVICHI